MFHTFNILQYMKMSDISTQYRFNVTPLLDIFCRTPSLIILRPGKSIRRLEKLDHSLISSETKDTTLTGLDNFWNMINQRIL